MSEQWTLQQAADQYFSSMNPLSTRIVKDLQAIKENYEDAWDDLSLQEQLAALDENIILPDAVLRYTMENIKYPLLEEINQKSFLSSFPKLAFSPGNKIIKDENDKNCRWRDEHSAPFSWETRSQLDFELPSPVAPNTCTTSLPIEPKITSPRPRVLPKPKPLLVEFEHPSIVLGGSCIPNLSLSPRHTAVQDPGQSGLSFTSADILTGSVKRKAKIVKPSAPPPLPPSKDVMDTKDKDITISVGIEDISVRDRTPSFGSDLGCKDSVAKGVDADLPKTGCEFLDNW